MNLQKKNDDTDNLKQNTTALPYTKEEMQTYDGDEDIDRILATMEQYLINQN